MENRNSNEKRVPISTVVVICACIFLFGVGLGGTTNFFKDKVSSIVNQPTGDLSKQDFSLYWQVYNELQKIYVEPSKLDTTKMYNGSIKGMVESIGDNATAFYDAEETAEYEKLKGGNYSGIGAELDYVNNNVVIVAPFEGSPAALAGIESGDVITEVDSLSVDNETLTQVVNRIRGDAGTTVKLSILRPRENYKKHEITIVRGNITSPSMSIAEVKDGIAVVRINRFTEASYNEWTNKWDQIASELQSKIQKGEVKSLIIDLRGNPGGYFDAAVYLAGDFLPAGTPVVYQRERSGDDKEFLTSGSPRFKDIPVVVLVNGGSASASEIFAGALKHYKRATIVGEKSYGKGTAQIVVDLSAGTSLHVTISKWLLPDKSWINPENPIIPDVEVKYDYEKDSKGEDNQLDKAKELAKSKQ